MALSRLERWKDSSFTQSSPDDASFAWRAFMMSDSVMSGSGEKTFCQVAVGIDAAVAQKRPPLALVADRCKVNFRQQQFLSVSGCLRNEFTHRTRDERAAPE